MAKRQKLRIKAKDKYGQNPKVRLTVEEQQLVNDYREQQNQFIKECELNGLNPEEANHYWFKSKKFSIHFKKDQKSYQQVRGEILKEMESYAPNYPKIKYTKPKDGHLYVISLADLHVGKLAHNYNQDKAVEIAKQAIQGLLNKAQGFKCDKILFLGGHDLLHVDNTKGTTTAGTFQNTSGMWYENFHLAKNLYIEIIEQLMQIAPVHFIHNMSNHDYMSGWFLADTISSWFKNCEQITFDISTDHRKYFSYYDSLIGSSHGDGAKQNDLPLLMAQESPEWSNTKYRYFYLGHYHSKHSKEYTGVTVEVMRSPSGKDAWHNKKGYVATRAVEMFVHSKTGGQVSRITEYVE